MPVPDWNRGDYHLSAGVDAPRDLLNVVQVSEVDPEDQATLETHLRAGNASG